MQPHITTRPEFIPLPPRAINRTGQRYGRLVVLGLVGRTPLGVLLWLCQCDCGNTSIGQSSNMTHGKTVSCGCYLKEVTSRRSKTHGMRKTKLYRTWAGILTRCFNPKVRGYITYGARGITMSAEWRASFEAFRDYVIQLPCYGENGYSLDRIDNDGNYEPGNVRWATRNTQQRNTRDNHLLTYDGRTQCVTAWAEEIGMKPEMLFCRLKLGWSAERALTQKPRKSPTKKRSTDQTPVVVYPATVASVEVES